MPKTHDVDVVVAGGGIAGCFAALAAARHGARALLVERFGMLGGNMGPGYMQGGTLVYFAAVVNGGTSLVREFHQRLAELRVRVPQAWDREPDIAPDIGRRLAAQGVTSWDQEPPIASYVISRMMDEANVRFLLSAYAADPIVEDGRVTGLFVETASGRARVNCRALIDATGEAAIAARAGCELLRYGDPRPQEELDAIEKLKSLYPDYSGAEVARFMGIPSMGGCVFLGGVDSAAFDAHVAQTGAPCKAGDLDFSRRQAAVEGVGTFEFQLNKGRASAPGIAGLRLEVKNVLDAGRADVLSAVEFHARIFCFETVQLMRRHTPGCANAYLLFVSPFLGSRGGTCVAGERCFDARDVAAERRFDDVIYRMALTDDTGRLIGPSCDVPYRIMLPRAVDGLLCAGRSASHRRLLRTRPNCMTMGHAAGIAAALAAETGKPLRDIPLRDFQRRLLRDGFFLGEEDRLQEMRLR